MAIFTTIGAVVGYAMMAGMAAGVANKAANAQCAKENIGKQIDAIKQKTADMKTKFATLNKDVDHDNLTIVTAMNDMATNIGETQAKMHVVREQFKETHRKLQIDGIILVCVVVFILFLKRIGFLAYLWENFG